MRLYHAVQFTVIFHYLEHQNIHTYKEVQLYEIVYNITSCAKIVYTFPRKANVDTDNGNFLVKILFCHTIEEHVYKKKKKSTPLKAQTEIKSAE